MRVIFGERKSKKKWLEIRRKAEQMASSIWLWTTFFQMAAKVS